MNEPELQSLGMHMRSFLMKMHFSINSIPGEGGEAFPYVCNVADRQSVYATAEQIRREVGKVSILINNAGIVSGNRLLEIPDENIQRTFDVNVLAHFWVCKLSFDLK